MAYYVVSVNVNMEGDIIVTVEVPLKFIVPSTRYIYNISGRKITETIAVNYFEKNEKENIKKYAELEYKSKYGEDINISSLKKVKHYIQNERLIIEYKAFLSRKKKKEEDIIL